MSSQDRRDFLAKMGTLSAALAGGLLAESDWAAAAAGPPLPQIQFGRYSISRLICGSNPFNGGSHLSTFVNREMRAYYTPEQLLKTLRHCQEVGINCWQISGPQNIEAYRQLVDEGGQMHAISLGKDAAELPALARGGCIGVAHHGEFTDKLFKDNRLEEVHDFVKRVRDAGMLTGVSTHMPAVVNAIESQGWDLDYYMTCVYQRHRTAEELQQLLGQTPLPVGEVYLAQDPPRMFKALQQTKRPCLAFKILAAGRLCDRTTLIEQAFRETLAAIKPSDAVIVGIYDRYTDQPKEDAAYVRRFGLPQKA
jgi:hypothetical protein